MENFVFVAVISEKLDGMVFFSQKSSLYMVE